MVDKLIAGRAIKNVRTADLARRSLVVSSAIFGGAFLPLLALWLLPLAAAATVPLVVDWDYESAALAFLVGQSGLSLYSIVTAPLLASAIAAPAIRTSGGARLRAGEITAHAFATFRRSAPASLAAGAITAAGFCACVVPGFVAAAVTFVVGPVAAVEGGSPMDALRRGARLTAGSRWVLFGVAFLIGFLERALLRLTEILLPQTRSGQLDADLASALLASAVCVALVTLLRAAASAMAYNDLRIASENLEPDAIVEELGGATSSFDDGALSERSIDDLAEKRQLLGKLTGQRDPGDEEAEAIQSARDLEAITKRRSARLRALGLAAGGVLVVGITVVLVMSLMRRRAESEQLSQAERDVAAAWATWKKTNEQLAEGGLPLDGIELASEQAAAKQIGRQIMGHVAAARPEQQRLLLYRLLAIHAEHHYGEGFTEAFRAAGSGQSGEDILEALEPEIRQNGCTKALEKARALPSKRPHAFAKTCPPGGSVTLSPTRLRPDNTLWAGVLATLLEQRAFDRRLEEDELHELVMQALVKEH